MIKKYVKKPIPVEVIQWTGDNFIEVDEFITVYHETFPAKGLIYIPVSEGTLCAFRYDYIIKGVNGEFYPCRPDTFEKTYECVENTNIPINTGVKIVSCPACMGVRHHYDPIRNSYLSCKKCHGMGTIEVPL